MYWTAVTYKTVAVYVILAAAIIFGVIYVVSPNFYQNTIKKISTAIDNSDSEAVAASQTQAKFVNLDGKVLVKKVNSVQWVQADFHTTLDKGDLVQTGPEGVARITFGDRTSYTVKPDTLITVEENVHGQQQADQRRGPHQHRVGRSRDAELAVSRFESGCQRRRFHRATGFELAVLL